MGRAHPARLHVQHQRFRLFTGHQTAPSALPKGVAETLGPIEKTNVYYKDMPADLLDVLWQRFREARRHRARDGSSIVVTEQHTPCKRALGYIQYDIDALRRAQLHACSMGSATRLQRYPLPCRDLRTGDWAGARCIAERKEIAAGHAKGEIARSPEFRSGSGAAFSPWHWRETMRPYETGILQRACSNMVRCRTDRAWRTCNLFNAQGGVDVSTLPSTEISATPLNETARLYAVGDLLDTLVAIRIATGHGANGSAASPALGPEQMQEVRALLDCAIASAKELLSSIHYRRDCQPLSLFTASNGQDRIPFSSPAT